MNLSAVPGPALERLAAIDQRCFAFQGKLESARRALMDVERERRELVPRMAVDELAHMLLRDAARRREFLTGPESWFTSRTTSMSPTTTNPLVTLLPTRPVDRRLRPGRRNCRISLRRGRARYRPLGPAPRSSLPNHDFVKSARAVWIAATRASAR